MINILFPLWVGGLSPRAVGVNKFEVCLNVEPSVKITYFKFTINKKKSQGKCMISVGHLVFDFFRILMGRSRAQLAFYKKRVKQKIEVTEEL